MINDPKLKQDLETWKTQLHGLRAVVYTSVIVCFDPATSEHISFSQYSHKTHEMNEKQCRFFFFFLVHSMLAAKNPQ